MVTEMRNFQAGSQCCRENLLALLEGNRLIINVKDFHHFFSGNSCVVLSKIIGEFLEEADNRH